MKEGNKQSRWHNWVGCMLSALLGMYCQNIENKSVNQLSSQSPVLVDTLTEAQNLPLPPSAISDSVHAIKESPAIEPTYRVPTKLLREYPLLPHLLTQKNLLIVHSDTLVKSCAPDQKRLIGRFTGGHTRIIFRKADSEPPVLYGKLLPPAPQVELEFVAAPFLKMQELDNLKSGHLYQITWIETIVDLAPFDHGYQRCFVACSIEPVSQ